MSTYRSEFVFNRYMRRAQESGHGIRPMSETDTKVVSALTDAKNDFGTVMTELFAITETLDTIGDHRLEYVRSNIRRVINSMVRQRDLILAARFRFSTLAPDPEEYKEILYFIRNCATRTQFIEDTVIKGNLELTPIHEHLVIQGRTFREDILSFFGTKAAICAASKKETDGIQKYVQYVMGNLEQHGAIEAYKERLNRYVQMDEEKRRKAKEERAAEKQEALQKLLRDGMDVFRRRFHKAVDGLKDDTSIHVSTMAIVRQFARHGRKSYVILRCTKTGDRLIFRYMRGDGTYTNKFYGAKVWESEAEAESMREKWQKEQPYALLEVTQLSEVATEKNQKE